MMNFVDTAASTRSPRIEAAQAQVQSAESTPACTGCKSKAFGVSLLLSMVAFSFTLTGLITATNWVTDNVVIPRFVQAGIGELSQPHPNFVPVSEDSVETTSAR